jgi:DNA-binding protein HU-beta
MNTAELVNFVAKKTKLPVSSSKEIVSCFLRKIMQEVKRGERIKLSGFGVFYRVKRKARQGRNPQSGESVKIKATEVPRFKPGKHFKDAVK